MSKAVGKSGSKAAWKSKYGGKPKQRKRRSGGFKLKLFGRRRKFFGLF